MNEEAVIIGGGPAGSAVAIELSRHGIPARVLERKPGPHHKVCGEFISYEAAHYLEDLGIDLAARVSLASNCLLPGGVYLDTDWITLCLSRPKLREQPLNVARQSGI